MSKGSEKKGTKANAVLQQRARGAPSTRFAPLPPAYMKQTAKAPQEAKGSFTSVLKYPTALLIRVSHSLWNAAPVLAAALPFPWWRNHSRAEHGQVLEHSGVSQPSAGTGAQGDQGSNTERGRALCPAGVNGAWQGKRPQELRGEHSSPLLPAGSSPSCHTWRQC